MAYTYIDCVENDGAVWVWVRSEDGLELVRHPLRDFMYCFIPNNTGEESQWVDMWGRSMKQCFFSSKKELKEFAQSEAYVCESDIAPNYRALVDKYPDADESVKVNCAVYDIEVQFDLKEGKGYPNAQNPYAPVNCIQTWDNHHNCYNVFLDDTFEGKITLQDDKYDVVMNWCSGEREILQRFAQYLKPIDLFGAWFGDGFDLPYLINRALLNFSEERALTMFCRDGFKAKFRDHVNDFGEEVTSWSTVGRKHVDLMEVYKKFIPEEKESYALDRICEEDLNMRKVNYEEEGNLGDLYREDPQKFFDYAIHDARLLHLLDQKHSLMEMAISIATGSSVLFDDVTGSVKPIDQGFRKFCREKNNIVVPDKTLNEKESYPGGIVYDTIPGRHEWVFTIDLRSLYPFTMVALGLSPETLLYQLSGGYEDYVAVMSRDDSGGPVRIVDAETGDVDEILPAALERLIREEGYTISAYGTIFDGSLGLLAEYVSSGFDLRSYYKDQMAKCYDAGDMDGAARYDLKQKVVKVARLNAIYGASGNQYFRFFDIRLAASITLTAQMVSKQNALAANEAIDILEDLCG